MNFEIYLVIIIAIMIIYFYNTKREHFDAIGMYYNIPSEWFIKPKYNLQDWITTQYFDNIEPSCLPYSRAARYGGMDNVNYLSSVMRFYRM
jgi:hypothetical protein